MAEGEQREEKSRQLARYRRKVRELEAELGQRPKDDGDFQEEFGASAESLLAAERIGSMANVARAIAHEINNPLATCMGYLRRALTLSEQRGEDEISEVLERLWRGAFRIKGIVGELQMLSEEIVGEDEKLDLAAVVERVAVLVPPELRAAIDYQLESAPVLVDRPRAYQIVYNSIMAHLLVTDHRTQEVVEVRSRPTDDGRARLEVTGKSPPRPGTRTDLLSALRGEHSPSTLPLRLAQQLAEDVGAHWEESSVNKRYRTAITFGEVRESQGPTAKN